MVKKFATGLLLIIIVFVVIFYKPIVQGFPIALNLLFNRKIELKHTSQPDAINILLLGVGGGHHDGPDLSDTIIFARVNPAKNEVDLVSLPRDLWVPELKGKINQAYSDGQSKGGRGILLSNAAISKVMGESIDYTIVVDFAGFVKVVDLLGGIDVNVVRTFDDYAYPVEGKETELCGRTQDQLPDLANQVATGSATDLDAFPCRYEHIHFNVGMQHMNGTIALKFVRSRHSVGIEGSDFSRSARQHLVIQAVKDKAFSLGTLLNPVKLLDIYNTLQDNIHTDIKNSEFDDFIKLAQKMKNAKVVNYVIDAGQGERQGLLVNPPLSSDYGGAWVVTPRIGSGNFSEIHDYLACIEKYSDCTVTDTGVVSAATLSTTPTPSAVLKKK